MAITSRNTMTRPAFVVAGALTSLSAVTLTTSTGTTVTNGAVFDLGACFSSFSFTAIPSGSTKVAVRMQGALVSSTGPWTYVSAASTWTSTSAGQPRKSTNTMPIRYVRLQVQSWTTKVGGQTVTGYIGVGQT